MSAFAQATCHSGMVNTVWPVQLQLNMIQTKNNATTAQRDSWETKTATRVFQDFEEDLMVYLWVFGDFQVYFFTYQRQFSNFKIKEFDFSKKKSLDIF